MSANKSKTYIIPYINDFIPIKFTSLLVNSYLFYKKEYKICLLYKFSGKKGFTDYESELMANEYFIEAVDVDKDHVLYVFEVPDELYEIIDMFLEGKYSYLPNKNIVKDFLIDHFKLTKNHRIFHILDRSPELKEELEKELAVKIPDGVDLSSPPDILTEEFK